MDWINSMAQMAVQGLPVNVGQLMDSLVTQQGGTPQGQAQAQGDGLSGGGVQGLIGGLKKEKRFVA
jgi:hypothetical protein